MVWVGVSVPSIGEFAPFGQRLRWRKGTGKQSADLTDLNIYYMEKRCPGLRAHAPTSSSGRAIFSNISLQKVAYRLPEKQKVLPRLKGWLCETRHADSFVICFCCLFWTWLCTTFNSIPIILNLLTDRNIAFNSFSHNLWTKKKGLCTV